LTSNSSWIASCNNAGDVANDKLILFTNYVDNLLLVYNNAFDVLAVPASPLNNTLYSLFGDNKIFKIYPTLNESIFGISNDDYWIFSFNSSFFASHFSQSFNFSDS